MAVGVLTLLSALMFAAAAAEVLPPLVRVLLLIVGTVALLSALVGWAYVGFVLALGPKGASGLVGSALWARTAGIGLGLAPVVSLVLGVIDAVAGGGVLVPTWDVCVTLLAVLTAIAVARGGAVRGSARWALAIPAAVQAVITVVELIPASSSPWLLVALTGGVLPAALIIAGAFLLHDTVRGSGPTVSTRLGRTSAQWEVDLPASIAVEHLRSFVSGQRRFTLIRLTEGESGAEAELSARPSWATWGGRVLLRLEPLADERTRVRAGWSPALVSTVLTWDQGERDLQRIAAGLAGPALEASEPVR